MDISYAFVQLLMTMPEALTAIVIGAFALARRDGGLWWKLVVTGAAVVLLGSFVRLATSLAPLLLPYETFSAFSFVSGVLGLLLSITGLALIGSGAIVGRRHPAPVA